MLLLVSIPKLMHSIECYEKYDYYKYLIYHLIRKILIVVNEYSRTYFAHIFHIYCLYIRFFKCDISDDVIHTNVGLVFYRTFRTFGLVSYRN